MRQNAQIQDMAERHARQHADRNPLKMPATYRKWSEDQSPAPSKAQPSPLPRSQYIEGDGTEMQLYVRSMGKLLAVTAMFGNDADSNAYCETHRDQGVVAEGGGLVFLANLHDHGTKADASLPEDKTKLMVRPAVNHADKLAEALQGLLDENNDLTRTIAAKVLNAYEAAQ